MQLFDAVTLGDARLTRDGYMVVDARIARTGILEYAGFEVDRPDMDKVRIYRPDEEVFSADALASFAHRPVTIDHPTEAVSAKNWRHHAVGATGDVISKDGGYVRVPLTLMDSSAIDIVKSGKRELSCGYTCDLKWEAGKTADGKEYDAIQTNIRGNHLAIVGSGRAGSECRIGDDDEKGRMGMTLQKLTIDGITVEMSDTAAQVVSKVQRQLADAIADNIKLTTDHVAAIAAKDKELGTKDAEIEGLKGKVLDDKKLDEAVAARASVVDQAKKIIGDSLDLTGKSLSDIRRAVVAKKFSDEKVKDKSDDYVQALFDGLAGDETVTNHDPVRQTVIDRGGNGGKPLTGDQAFAGLTDYYENAWKGEKAGA